MVRVLEFRAKISKSGDRYLIKIPSKIQHLVREAHEKRLFVNVRIEVPDGNPPTNK